MEQQEANTFNKAMKKLSKLEPPKMRRVSPFEHFTADLQSLNHFFWSTEIAYASTWSTHSDLQESKELASLVLAKSNANAFKKRTSKQIPHYKASVGSFLVQLRWNYDSLGRYGLIEIMSILEIYIRERLKSKVGDVLASRHLTSITKELLSMDIELDSELVYRLWLLKEIRNDIVHDRSTIHSFPSEVLSKRIDSVTKSALKWSDDEDWPQRLQSAYNEMIITTHHAGKHYDLPHIFFITIYAMSRVVQFARHLELLLTSKRFNSKRKKT